MKRPLRFLLIGISVGALSATAGAQEVGSTPRTDSLTQECAAKSGAARDACVEEAKARSQGTAATSRPSDPVKQPMSKEEESKSMPLPGQANDHSTTAKDVER